MQNIQESFMKIVWQKIGLGFMLFIMSVLASAATLPVTAITPFDSSRYLGAWYEVARLPMYFERHCEAPIIARYRLDPENPQRILVSNSCQTSSGIKMANGVADFVERHHVAKLTVSFLPTLLRWLPFTRGDYWVLSTDYTGYALVGSPDHKYLWILSRSEKLDQVQVQRLLTLAQAQGYAIDQLIFQNLSRAC
jgi:apolipoprotein D and lipocalin family protein